MNNYFNNMQSFDNIYPKAFSNENKNEDNKLIKKLKKQGGNNMNFNKANFNGNTDPSKLYDIYNGFIRGNMYPDLYNEYKINRPYDIRPMNDQAELLTKVDAYCFACHDVNLYLDTHPNDKDMLNLFTELSKDVKTVTDEYEKKYGPLFVNSSKTYPWAWNESPWPWENY